MSLLISTRQGAEGEVVVIDGRLSAEGVPELERVLAWLSGPPRLDLVGLRSADEAGVEALRALCARGASLTGASPYFRLLLEVEKPSKAREPPAPV